MRAIILSTLLIVFAVSTSMSQTVEGTSAPIQINLNDLGKTLGKNKKDKRLALVIGNAEYQFTGKLANPLNDARSLTEALKNLGFEVMKYENATQKELRQAIDDFGEKLSEYNTGLFYYAGHGIQSEGNNFMIPVEANFQKEEMIKYDCVAANRVLSYMESSGNDVNIVILDACRNNPFKKSWTRSTETEGLAYINAPSGSIVAYATSPGQVAMDGEGRHGIYTESLLQHIKTPGINILQMFQRVRASVVSKSRKKQIPWESTSLTGDFYFSNR